MGDLRVVNKAQPDINNCKVNIEGNVRISNRKGTGKLQKNDAETQVKNGKVTSFYQWDNKSNPTKENALNLNASNFLIFDGVRQADKSDKDGKKLTKSDLEALRKDKAMQKKLGVTVKYDAKEQVYGLYGKDGSTLYFDFD